MSDTAQIKENTTCKITVKNKNAKLWRTLDFKIGNALNASCKAGKYSQFRLLK